MRLLRRAYPAPLLAASMIALAGCQAGALAANTAHIDDPAAVIVAVSGTPASLDFTRNAGAAIPQAMMANIYETLVKIDKHGAITPWLATSWDLDKSGTVYTFHLRKNVRFSDGSPFNAHTVKFSIDRVNSKAWTNGQKKKMSIVTDVKVVDEDTVRVTLAHRSNEWLWSMGTMIGAQFSPTGVSDDNLTKNPVGTGPFTVSAFAPGHSITYSRRDNYWGTPAASKAVAIRYFADATSATNALQAGDVDVVYSMQSPELLDVLKARKIYTIKVGTTNGEILLSMNMRRFPFTDVRVRKAIFYGLNRQAIIDTAWDGYGLDTGGVPVPPTDPWYYKSTRYPYDPAKARELLKQAGINKTNNRIVISVPSRPYAQNVSEMLVSQLNDIGFDTHITSTEFPAVWLKKVYKDHDYDMSVIMHIEPHDVPSIFGNPNYYLGFDSAKVRNLLSQAEQAPPADYAADMKKAVKQIMAEAAADTLFNYPNIVVFAPHSGGINANAVTDALDLSNVYDTDKPFSHPRS